MNQIQYLFSPNVFTRRLAIVTGVFIFAIMQIVSLVFSVPIVLAVDTELIDTQDAAIATNLELFGGSPTDMTVDPTGDGFVAYVTTYTPNGIFSTQNGGTTWQGLPASDNYGAAKSVMVNPNTGVAYVAIGDDVITTSDNGQTWTSLTDNLVGNPLIGSEIAWADGTIVVAVDNGAVQYSDDNGESFTAVTLSAGVRKDVISMSADSTGQVYAVLKDNDTEATTVFMSPDRAVTWNELDVEAGGVAADSVFYSIAVDPLDDNHVVLGSYNPNYNSYHSFDAGVSWTALLNGENRIGGQDVVFDGVGGMYVGINYTNDASVVSPIWSEITTQTPLSSVRGDLYAVDATHPTTIFSNTALGVAKSEDGGATWKDVVEGISAVKTYAISQANDKNVVWLGANGGLAKSTNFTDDNNETNDNVEWEYPISPEEGGSSVYAVWVKPSDGNYVVTGSSNFLWYTEDGGDTWTQADAPEFMGTVDRITSSPTNTGTLYAMYVNTSLIEDEFNGGILQSTDFGQTWVEMNFPTTLADGGLAVADNGGEDVVYVGVGLGGSESAIYVHRGEDWEKLDADFNEFYVNDLLVLPEDNNIILASFEAESTLGSLYKSIDGGETWEPITEGLDQANHLGAMAVQPGATTTLYLAGQDGSTGAGDGVLYKSTDGGDSWSLYYRGKRQEFFYALLFDGLVAGNDRGIFDLKSLAKVTLKVKKKEDRYQLTAKLRDAATSKKLTQRKVTFYRKKGNRPWKVLARRKTNSKGVVSISAVVKKNTKLKAVWKPTKKDRAEYTNSTSRIVQVKK